MSDNQEKYDIGMVGLGVMGRNFVLNMADQGFAVAGYDKDLAKVDSLHQERQNRKVQGATDIKEFIALLRNPRAIMILVPAGDAVDAVINDLLPHLQEGDLIIDGGNSYFKDTDVRISAMQKKNLRFLGVGISGGEEGARHGPCIMPGGSKESYERVRPIFEAAAAKVNNKPCVTWLGEGSSGHYVKMVHNGIEYGIMQLLAEAYDLLRRGLGLNDDEIHKVFSKWDSSDLNGYLVEITSDIFNKDDEKTGKRLIDEILDVARQKGTGMWTSQSAMELQVPVPTIDQAVAMRDMSVFTKERFKASEIYKLPIKPFKTSRDLFISQLSSALYTAIALTYAQGLALLSIASEKYKYNLDLEAVPRIWRGGCIIRSALLEDISAAYRVNKNLPNLLLDPHLSGKISEHQEGLRRIVSQTTESGIPIPALMASLGYFDAYRSAWLPANLIQAQRDYFGSHTYEMKDTKGTFHTIWKKEKDVSNQNDLTAR